MPGQDFISHLEEQLNFLRTSVTGFDAGNEAEAKRIAVQLRLLLYDAPRGGARRSVSLLSQLGVRDTMPWLDTAIAPDPSWEHDFALGLCRLSGEGKGPSMQMRYVAPLDDLGPDREHPVAAFADWWTMPVLADRHGHHFSRRDFVRFVANQDGGAHVDAELDASYEALTRSNSMQISAGKGMLAFQFGVSAPDLGDTVGPPSSSLALVSNRQIAHEVITTINSSLVHDHSSELLIPNPICALSLETEIVVSRNDPCPCGSGLKLKRCFGMRAPRNPRRTQSAAISMK